MDKELWLIGPSKAHYLNLEQWSTPLKTDHFQEKSFVSEDNFDEDQWMCWCCNDVLMSRGGVRALENIKHVWWHSEIMIKGQGSMLSLRSLTPTFALSSVIQRWFASRHNVSFPSKPRHWHWPLLNGRQWLDKKMVLPPQWNSSEDDATYLIPVCLSEWWWRKPPPPRIWQVCSHSANNLKWVIIGF